MQTHKQHCDKCSKELEKGDKMATVNYSLYEAREWGYGDSEVRAFSATKGFHNKSIVSTYDSEPYDKHYCIACLELSYPDVYMKLRKHMK